MTILVFNTEGGSRPSTADSSLRPPTVLQEYLESRTMLKTQESRAEAISRVRSKMFEKKEEGLGDDVLEEEDGDKEEVESFADTAESELRCKYSSWVGGHLYFYHPCSKG